MQWGKFDSIGASAENAVILPLAFSNANYIVVTNTRGGDSSAYQVCIYSRTTTTFSGYYHKAGAYSKIDFICLGM